jgi:hypothetical protein
MKKRIFEDLAVSKAKTALAKCIGPFCTDFNTKKNYEVILRKFVKKNVFAQKYDEIEDLTVGKYYSSPAVHEISSTQGR